MNIKAAILALMSLSTVSAQTKGAIDWDQHFYDEEEYFKGIPDLIDIPKTRFSFKIIHWFLTGIERGMYNDDSISIDSDCFGDFMVTKLNEYVYLFSENPFEDQFQAVIPEVSLTYQFFYMLTSQCDLDRQMNDFSVYCWYQGCWPEQIWQKMGGKWLYVLRSLNDAGIVWWEGIPKEQEDGNYTEEEMEQWINLSEQTGQTLSQILKDVTGFYPIPKDQRK